MKKLLVIAVLAMSFAACEKEDTDKHCWKCEWPQTTTDDRGTVSSTVDSSIVCDMSPQQIKIHEDRYKGRILLNTTYGDMKCNQIPDTTTKK